MISEAEISKERLKTLLSEWPELSHIKVRSRGNLLTLESTDEEGITYPHARFKKKSGHKWYLEMPVKRGWEFTFMEGTLPELLGILIEKFPWSLAIR
jgi:hypothetical protein